MAVFLFTPQQHWGISSNGVRLSEYPPRPSFRRKKESSVSRVYFSLAGAPFENFTRQTVRGRARSNGRMIQFSSINPWFSIHVDLTIFVWSLNLQSFEQQHQFNRKIKVKQVFLRNLLQFPWSRNIFARHMASRILWRSGFTGSNPILVFLLKKLKKSCSKSDQKEGPVCVKY